MEYVILTNLCFHLLLVFLALGFLGSGRVHRCRRLAMLRQKFAVDGGFLRLGVGLTVLKRYLWIAWHLTLASRDDSLFCYGKRYDQ